MTNEMGELVVEIFTVEVGAIPRGGRLTDFVVDSRIWTPVNISHRAREITERPSLLYWLYLELGGWDDSTASATILLNDVAMERLSQKVEIPAFRSFLNALESSMSCYAVITRRGQN